MANQTLYSGFRQSLDQADIGVPKLIQCQVRNSIGFAISLPAFPKGALAADVEDRFGDGRVIIWVCFLKMIGKNGSGLLRKIQAALGVGVLACGDFTVYIHGSCNGKDRVISG